MSRAHSDWCIGVLMLPALCVPAIMHRECRRCKNTSEKNGRRTARKVCMDSSWTAYGWCYFRPYIVYIMAQNIGICITWCWFSRIPYPFLLFCLPTNRKPWFGGSVCMFARVFHSPQKTPSPFASSQYIVVLLRLWSSCGVLRL